MNNGCNSSRGKTFVKYTRAHVQIYSGNKKTKQTKPSQKSSRTHLPYLLLLQVVSLDDDLALEGPAVAIVEHPLLGQQLGLLLSLRVLHILLVLGQSLLLLFLGCAVVLAHLLRDTSRGASARSSEVLRGSKLRCTAVLDRCLCYEMGAICCTAFPSLLSEEAAGNRPPNTPPQLWF